MSPTKMTSKTENGDGVLFALADQIEERLEMAASRIGGITPSLPACAFKGEL